jgi:hypothetical protein
MLTKRTPRACERCRRTRRRCKPPHPCPACLAAGVPCEVRIKARPKREKARNAAVSGIDDDVDALDAIILSDETSPIQLTPENSFPSGQMKRPVDTFEQVHELVRALLKDRCGM